MKSHHVRDFVPVQVRFSTVTQSDDIDTQLLLDLRTLSDHDIAQIAEGLRNLAPRLTHMPRNRWAVALNACAYGLDCQHHLARLVVLEGQLQRVLGTTVRYLFDVLWAARKHGDTVEKVLLAAADATARREPATCLVDARTGRPL